MLNLLDPSEFVKRFVSTITLTKEDRDLFDQGKIENAKITAIADFVKEAGSDSVNETALLEKIKSFKFPEITSKAPKLKKKTPAKKPKVPKEKKPSRKKQLEDREESLLGEQQSLIEEQKQLQKQIEEAKKNIKAEKEKASQKSKAPRPKKPTPPVAKEKGVEEEVFEEETQEGAESVSEEIEGVSEETLDDENVVVFHDHETTEQQIMRQQIKAMQEELERLERRKKLNDDKVKELVKTRDETKKNLDDLLEKGDDEEESEEEEEVEEESEEEFVFGEGLALDELSNQISNFIDDATSQSEIDALRGIVKEFKSKHLDFENDQETFEDVINRADKASKELFNKLNKKEKEIKKKEESTSLLQKLGQTFFDGLRNSNSATDVEISLGSLVLGIEVSADNVETEDYQYLFGSKDTQQSLCKDIAEENFNFLDIRKPIIELSEKLNEVEGDEVLETKIVQKLYIADRTLDKMLIVAGLSEYKMGDLSDKAGLSLEDYQYGEFSENLREKFGGPEEDPGFTEEEKAILRAYCGFDSERVDFTASKGASESEDVFVETMKFVAEGNISEYLIDALTYMYNRDLDSLSPYLSKIKKHLYDERIPAYEIKDNLNNPIRSLLSDLKSKKDSLSQEKQDLLDIYRRNILAGYPDINEGLFLSKLMPFLHPKEISSKRDLRDFKNLIRYFLIIYDSIENPFEDYKEFEEESDILGLLTDLKNPSIEAIEQKSEEYSKLFYNTSNNVEKAALLINDLHMNKKLKDFSEDTFVSFLNRNSGDSIEIIKSFDPEGRLELYTKEDLSKAIRALIPKRGKTVSYNSILHNIKDSFKRRDVQPEDVSVIEEGGVITTKAPEKNIFLDKVKELDLAPEIEPQRESQVEPQLEPEKAKSEESEDISAVTEDISAEVYPEEKFEKYDKLINVLNEGVEDLSPKEFLEAISPLAELRNFNNIEVESVKEYIKPKLADVVTTTRNLTSKPLTFILGKAGTEEVYSNLTTYLNSIIYAADSNLSKSAAEELYRNLNLSYKRIEELSYNLLEKLDNMLEDPSEEEIEELQIVQMPVNKLKPSEVSCDKLPERRDIDIYAFAPNQKFDKKVSASIKKLTAKEYKELKDLCKTKNPNNLYSFVSNIVSKYGGADQNDDMPKESLQNYFSGNGKMPESLSKVLVKYFGNEFYRPLSFFKSVDKAQDLNLFNLFLVGEDGDALEPTIAKKTYDQISEVFSDGQSLAKNLAQIFLGWNLEKGIYFNVENSLLHVSKENSRLAFENVKNAVAFSISLILKQVYNKEMELEFNEVYEEFLPERLKYYDNYMRGQYSKEFMNEVKELYSKDVVDDITMVKAVDNLAKQDKPEQEIAIDISDFCKTIESINKARKNEGLKAYKDKDLFGTQKYKKFLGNTKANISKAIKSICDSDNRTLASVAAILFAPKEVNFNAFLQKSFIAGLTEKQFTSSLKKLFEEFDVQIENLKYLSKNDTDLKTDQYYKALAQKILEKMDSRLILGTIVQSAFYDKSILEKDNDEEYEVVFSDDVIPVSRENFTEQLNMLAEFANESINELMGGETIETTELKPDSEEAVAEEVSLAKKIENEIKSQTTEEGLETIFADINLYKDQNKITSGEFANLKQMIENKGFEISRKQVSKKQNKKMKLKPSAIKKKKKSDFYLKIISYANVFDEDADDFSKNGKVFSFAIAIDSLNDLLSYLKEREFEDIAGEVGFNFIDEDELLLSDREFEELNSEIKNIIKKVQEEEDKYYLQKESAELNEISDVGDVELLSKKILRGQFKDIYLFETADKEGLRRGGEPMTADEKFENGSVYIYPLSSGDEVLLGIYTDERKFVKELRDSKYIRILDIIEN